MAQSIKHQIQQNLLGRIKNLSWVNFVTTRDTETFAIDNLPAVVVRVPAGDPAEDGVVGRQDHDVVVHMTIKVAGNASEAEVDQYWVSLLSEIGADKTFGGLAYGVDFGPWENDISDSGKIIAEVQQLITIRYRTDLWSV